MSSSPTTKHPARHRLGQAISSALVLALTAPHAGAELLATGMTADEASAARKAEYAQRLPDLGSDIAPSRTAQHERLLGEALGFLRAGGSTDALADRAANAALDAGADALRAAGLPFLGSLQGGVTYNSTLNRIDFDVLSMLPLAGDDTGAHWLLQLGAHNLRDRSTTNAGLVYRWLDPEGKYLVGANAFYDHDFDAGAKRLGLGAEAANDTLRVFTNAYAPLGGWVDSPEDEFLQERPSRGFDFGLAWTPRELSMLDLQMKGSKWKGNGVDVFGNGRTEIDPVVWSTKATLTPVQALRVGLEHSQVAGGGDKDLQAMLSWVYRFGVPLAQQWDWNHNGPRNDLRQRLLSPVEREKRIVMDTREKYDAPTFASATLTATVLEGQAFTQLLDIAGGALPLTLSLSGPDAARFSLAGTVLTLPAQQFDAPADAGADNTYDVTVSVVDVRGRQATQQVAVSVLSAAPTARNARIEGDPRVGTTLALDYDFFSPLDEAEDVSARSIQWFRRAKIEGDTDIAEASGMQYTPVADDVGYVIGARVTVRSTTGRTGASVEVLGEVVRAIAGANAPTADPSLQGSVLVGALLTGSVGYADADGDQPATHLYQWYRAADAAGTDAIGIVGASSATYRITEADVGQYLIFEVTPRSLTGTPDVGAPARVATRIAVPAPAVGSAPTASPTLDGLANLGATLVGHVGYADADDDAPGEHEYRWYRATDAAGTQRTLIADATTARYTAVEADVGMYLVFEVTPRAMTGLPSIGAPVSVVSDRVGDDILPAANPTVALTGARIVGKAVLDAHAGYAHPDNVPAGTHLYQWFRADDAAGTNLVAIANANASTYTPVAADQGKHLRVQVTPKTVDGVSGGATLSANGIAMPWGVWGYQAALGSVSSTVYAQREIVVSGRTSPASRVLIEVGRADADGEYSTASFIVTAAAPGTDGRGPILFADLANGEARTTLFPGSILPGGENGTWTIHFGTFARGPDNSDFGGIDYATIEFLD